MLYISTSVGVLLMPNCGQNMPFYIFCMKNEQKGRKINVFLGLHPNAGQKFYTPKNML